MRAFVLSLILVLCGSWPVLAEIGADQVLRELYARKIAADQAGDFVGGRAVFEAAFTTDLRKEYEAGLARGQALEIPVVDFDIAYGAQDFDVREFDAATFRFELADLDSGRLGITAIFTLYEEERRVRYVMVPDAEGWKIDDIDYGDATLREILVAEP
ncbi:MAG: hypothetical protein GC199_11030 [Alphaproteobacteria bacterium]|nr:hypothetical protein [Alphaproteobacteria bacterium]